MNQLLQALIVCGLCLSAKLALADSPPLPELPAEDFSYNCRFTVSHQITNEGGTCYAIFEGTKVLKKSDGADNWYNEVIVHPEDIKDFKKVAGSGECPATLQVKNSNTFFSFRVSKHNGGDLKGRYAVSAHIRVSSPAHELLKGSSDTIVPYNLGFVSVNAGLDSGSTTLAYGATCKLVR